MAPSQLTLRLTDGRWVTIQRLSVFDRIDFRYHLQQSYKLLDDYPDTPLVKIYEENDQLRYHVDTCLELCTIPPCRVSDTQLVSLLFATKRNPYGILNEFNFNLSEAASNTQSPGRPDTKGAILGRLWRSTGSLNTALKLCTQLPTDVLEDALYELKPEEEKNKDKAKEALKRMELKNGVSVPTTNR